MHRFLLCAFSFCFTTVVQADQLDYRRIVAFGDSLSDNGNLAHNLPFLKGVKPLLPGYFEGRFSNGPTWVELLAPARSTAGNGSMERFWSGPALFFGPYETGNGVNNVNAAIGGAATASGFFPPPVSNQVERYLFVDKGFGSGDLVSIQGGANDLFTDFTRHPAPKPGEAEGFGRNAAGNAASNLQAVVAGGARAVLASNLPDLGVTPAYANGPTAQAAHEASSAYNEELGSSLRRIAAANPNVDIVQMDWSSAFDLIRSRPQAFGFSDVTTPCFDEASKAICDNPDSRLFWDGVHPSAAGHKLLARYAGLLLSTEQAGLAVAPLGRIALGMRLSAGDVIFRRVLSTDRDLGGGYVEAISEKGSLDGRATRLFGDSAVDYTLAGLRAGFDAGEGGLGLGGAFAYREGQASSGLLNADIRSLQMDGYLLGRHSFWFAGLEGGISLNEFDGIRRDTGFPALAANGSTHGIDFALAGSLGAERRLGAFTLAPAVRVGYASVEIDGFTEEAPILALSYTDRAITTGFWSARLRAAATLPKRQAITAYGEIGYEALFSTHDSYTAKLASNTAHAAALHGDVSAKGLYLKAGLDAVINDTVRLSGEYGLALQDGSGTVHNARLKLTIPF